MSSESGLFPRRAWLPFLLTAAGIAAGFSAMVLAARYLVVVIALGATGALYAQIASGAPYDLFLAADDPRAVRAYATRTGLAGNTRNSITDPTRLERELALVRARGYAPTLIPGPIASRMFIDLHPDILDFTSNLPLMLVDTFGQSLIIFFNR